MRLEKKQFLIFLSLSFVLLNIGGFIYPIQAQEPSGTPVSQIPRSSIIQNVGILAAPVEVTFNYTLLGEISMNLLFQNVTDINNITGNGPNHKLNLTEAEGYFSIVGTQKYIQDVVIRYNSATQQWFYEFNLAPIELNKVPDLDNIQLEISFNLKTNKTSYSNETHTIKIPHQITFSYTVSKSGDTVKIQAQSVFSTFYTSGTNGRVNASLLNIHHYTIKNVNETGITKEGDLSYIESTAVWDADVDISGLVGDFYVIVTFGIVGLEKNFSSPTTPNTINSFKRDASVMDYLIYILIAGAVLIIFLVTSFIKTAKKNKESLERKTPGQKSKPIEIIEISKAELKKSRISAPPAQKKVKKVDKSGLIFDVPTWEVDETESETTPETAPEPSNEPAPSFSPKAKSSVPSAPIAPVTPPKKPVAPSSSEYTLHCSSCNSWFEVEQYMKIDCPKCNAPLNVAMWCVGCKKWFDIPEPGDYNCPKCSKKLQYTKS